VQKKHSNFIMKYTANEPESLASFLLITTNYHPEPTATGKYNGELIEWLVNNGHNCTVVTTYPHYPHWKVQPPYKNGWFKKETKRFTPGGALLTVYRCPGFIPAVPTGKNRLIQEFTFLVSAIFVMINLLFKKRCNYSIAVAPPFHTVFLARFYKFFKKTKIVYHIQDLQIDTAEELGMLKSKALFNQLYKLEKNQFRKSDFVSTISDGMIKKIKSKYERDVIFFPNWVDTGQFFPLENRNELKRKWGYNDTDFICLYSGGIGEKQGLEVIIHAAKLLNNNKQIKFIICGIGQYKAALEKLANDFELKNLVFLPLQDKSVFNEFLNMGDLHLVIQKSKASDLALPSKLTTILSVGGVAIITAFPGTSLYNLTHNYDLGFTCNPDDPEALANALLKIVEEDLTAKRINASVYAKNYISIQNVISHFVSQIDS
jgi:colanic acid biosynthesis glycosyl transferase WcaI